MTFIAVTPGEGGLNGRTDANQGHSMPMPRRSLTPQGREAGRRRKAAIWTIGAASALPDKGRGAASRAGADALVISGGLAASGARVVRCVGRFGAGARHWGGLLRQ